MTENEAIKVMKWYSEEEYGKGLVSESHGMAIQALEEIQQYRAIGKVEEVEYLVDSYNAMIHDFGDDMSTLEQYRAIGTVEDLKIMKENGAFSGVELAQILAMQMELKKYQSIGTIEEFKALKEKDEPKKAIGKRKYDEAYCPACNEVISDGEFWALDEYVHHCNYCGQAVKGVDWSE